MNIREARAHYLKLYKEEKGVLEKAEYKNIHMLLCSYENKPDVRKAVRRRINTLDQNHPLYIYEQRLQSYQKLLDELK